MAASLHIYLQMIKVGKELEAQLNLGGIFIYMYIYIFLKFYTVYCTEVLQKKLTCNCWKS